MSQVQADRQATSLSRQSTSSIAPVDRPSQFIPHLPAPPTPPSVKRLDLVERNAVKREYEKSMYKYMAQHGTLSTTEICGPCERNHTPCIRLPAMKKCALCFRGHDVCEMWDETVTNAGRRRTNHPKNQKKEHKKDNKTNADRTENVTVSLDQWAFHFEQTKKILYKRKLREQEEMNQKLRTAIFPNSKLFLTLTKDSTNENKQSTKRKQPTIFTVSNRPKKKSATLKPNPLRPKKKIITLKIKRLRTALSNDPTPSLNSSDPPIQPRPPCPPVRSANTNAYDIRVRKIHDEGTIVITPCLHCFNSLQQCIKIDLSGTCSSCLHIRRKCEGAVEMGKWVDSDGKRVWENSSAEAVVRYRAAVDLCEKVPFADIQSRMGNVDGIENDRESSQGTGFSDDGKGYSNEESIELIDKSEAGILGGGKEDSDRQSESLSQASRLDVGFDIGEGRKELPVIG